MILAFHKPYGVLSAFRPDGSSHATLADFNFPERVYPVGRLDADSEGLLLLSDEAWVTKKLLSPGREHPREYWAQVERFPSPEALRVLEGGVVIQGKMTKPCRAALIDVDLPEREPPIRFRKNVPTAWLALQLTEGRNRQVRRMTAKVGHPTLRLLRVRIGEFTLGDLPAGSFRSLDQPAIESLFQRPSRFPLESSAVQHLK